MELVYWLKHKIAGYQPKNVIPLEISSEGDAYLKVLGNRIISYERVEKT